MSWTLLHRAREGTDVMQVLIGDANAADVNGATGWDFISPDLSDDTTAWGPHTGDFVVPPGQTCTRFAFRTVSTGSGSPSVGNFLDAVSFTVTIPAPPTPRPTRRHFAAHGHPGGRDRDRCGLVARGQRPRHAGRHRRPWCPPGPDTRVPLATLTSATSNPSGRGRPTGPASATASVKPATQDRRQPLLRCRPQTAHTGVRND